MTYGHKAPTICPYCGGAAQFAFSAEDWNQNTSSDRFRYRKCRACGLTLIEKIPENLELSYRNEQYDIPADSESLGPRGESQRWKVDILKALVAPGSLLEIGPATGEFAVMARQAGFTPRLMEMNKGCCAFLADKLGLDVIRTVDPAKCLSSEGGQYEAICVWQAIEHIPEFWGLLDVAVDHLVDGGVIVMSTPNPRSIQARILKGHWPHIDAPRHLYLIYPKSGSAPMQEGAVYRCSWTRPATSVASASTTTAGTSLSGILPGAG